MAFAKHTLQVLILTTVIASIYSNCPASSVMWIDDSMNKSCVPCPQNCSLCYMAIDGKPICAFCREEFYMGPNHECIKCVDNCSSCTGGNISQCKHLKPGFFYDHNSNQISKCVDDTCSSCNPSDFCIACKEGYYAASVAATPSGFEKVTCKSCEIENCVHCSHKKDQVKDSTYLSCTLCKSGYGIVGGKCEKCPDSCLYCHEESKECTFCEAGYMLNKSSNTCDKISIEQCYTVNEMGSCGLCESHFFLKDGSCIPCKQSIDYCNYCTTKAESLMCLSCQIGYFLVGNVCKPCGTNCNHCSPDKCYSCSDGYYYNPGTNACEKCAIDKCDVCKTDKICDVCVSGYYFDQKLQSCQP